MPEEDLSLQMQSLTVISLCFRHTNTQIEFTDFKKKSKKKTMVMRQQKKTRGSIQDKGKQKMAKPKTETSKRGRKTKQETLHNISQAYFLGNPPQIKNRIQGWEKESHNNEEDNEAEGEILDLITDLGNTRGRLSLFNQTVHMYWIIKCVLVKAMQSLHPGKGNETQSVTALFQDINIQI